MSSHKPDAASRIAAKYYQEGTMDHAVMAAKLSKDIRRSITAERRRCEKIVEDARRNHDSDDNGLDTLDAILAAIRNK